MKPTDLQFQDLNSFAMCVPLTPAGVAWCEEHVPDYTGEPFMIDWRCLDDVVNGARAADLICRDIYESTL